MVHNMDQGNGKTALFLRLKPAWHPFANYITKPGERPNIWKALELGLLADWNVRVEPWFDPTVDFNGSAPMRVVRDNPFDPNGLPQILGAHVESRYSVFSNEMLAGIMEHMVYGDVEVESAGSIANGRKTFISLLLPEPIILDPNGRADEVKRYILGTTSFDGSTSTMFLNTDIRTECQNTFNMAIRGAQNIVKVRHTRNAEEKAKMAREALGHERDYMKAFQREAQALIERETTTADLWKVINAVYPEVEEDGRGKTLRENKVLDIIDIYNGPTCANIKGTAWGIVNALTEYEDYYKPTRGENKALNVALRASGFDAAATTQRGAIVNAAKTLLLV